MFGSIEAMIGDALIALKGLCLSLTTVPPLVCECLLCVFTFGSISNYFLTSRVDRN